MFINANGPFKNHYFEIPFDDIIAFKPIDNTCIPCTGHIVGWEKIANRDYGYESIYGPCDQQCPCKHTVEITFPNGQSYPLDSIDARQIAYLYLRSKQDMPAHFTQYATTEQQQYIKPIGKVIEIPISINT